MRPDVYSHEAEERRDAHAAANLTEHEERWGVEAPSVLEAEGDER